MDFSELNEIDGLQFIPVNEKKQPLVKDWQTKITKHNLSNCYGVGLVCGEPSGMVEALDFDLKYDITGTLYQNYKKIINEECKGLLEKMVVQKTKNNGFHFIYRCKKIDGNIKLANRNSTDQEKKDTYDTSYKNEVSKGIETALAEKIAKKHSDNDKVRVLIETRGLGGQIVISPTDGYKLVFGDVYGINEITEGEREILHSVARQFNTFYEEVEAPRTTKVSKTVGLSSFEDYNERGDVIQLLESNGWKFVKNKGQKSLMLRPGKSDAVTSGNYDHSLKLFSVFTTSTEFEPNKGYKPYAVFTYLECNKDFSDASHKLFDMGFGERTVPKEKKEYQSTRKIPSRINEEDDDYSFIAKPEDYHERLQQRRLGTMPMGLTTGSPDLDEWFRFKLYNFVMVNGHDNTGKSVFIWWLLLIAAMYHGWKGIIYSSENTLDSFMAKMVQFYWGKPLHGKNAMNEEEYKTAKEFIEKYFILIKAEEELYNYKDIINMVKKARKKHPDLTYGMIDPYNSLKIDLTGFSKLSTHEYHYEALSELKAYGQKNQFGWFINHHAVTAALRLKDADKKYPVAPQKADTEGGGKVANKADDFLTIHRITQHPTDWMVTEVHVRKMKETDTGGRVTNFDNPVKFEMYKNGCAFIERLEMGGNPVDPIEAWHRARGVVTQQQLIPNVTWTPYPTDDDDLEPPF